MFFPFFFLSLAGFWRAPIVWECAPTSVKCHLRDLSRTHLEFQSAWYLVSSYNNSYKCKYADEQLPCIKIMCEYALQCGYDFYHRALILCMPRSGLVGPTYWPNVGWGVESEDLGGALLRIKN